MLLRLRPYFAELTQEDIELFWREFRHVRGKPGNNCPFTDGIEMFDYFHDQGLLHCELTAGIPLTYRTLIGKIYGQSL
jgi:hypothetical protein